MDKFGPFTLPSIPIRPGPVYPLSLLIQFLFSLSRSRS